MKGILLTVAILMLLLLLVGCSSSSDVEEYSKTLLLEVEVNGLTYHTNWYGISEGVITIGNPHVIGPDALNRWFFYESVRVLPIRGEVTIVRKGY